MPTVADRLLLVGVLTICLHLPSHLSGATRLRVAVLLPDSELLLYARQKVLPAIMEARDQVLRDLDIDLVLLDHQSDSECFGSKDPVTAIEMILEDKVRHGSLCVLCA